MFSSYSSSQPSSAYYASAPAAASSSTTGTPSAAGDSSAFQPSPSQPSLFAASSSSGGKMFARSSLATPLSPSKRKGDGDRSVGGVAEQISEGGRGKKAKVEDKGKGRAVNEMPNVQQQLQQLHAASPAPVGEAALPAGVKELPHDYMKADAEDLILLVASMLTKLIAHNDQVPLRPEDLTRFHSRSPPGISVVDYLRRIVRYTNIEKSPLLILLPYLDAFCAHLPTFTLSSLTVHRFLISSACVASKALCDSFCTNSHYAKVGGIKVDELNLLERELIAGLGWKLNCEAILLQSYYTSLITSYSSLGPAPGLVTNGGPPIAYRQAPPPPPPPPKAPPPYLPWPPLSAFEGPPQ